MPPDRQRARVDPSNIPIPISGDPGAGFDPTGEGRITHNPNPSGDEQVFWRNNTLNAFLSFGYYPTEMELQTLIPTSMGTGGEQTGQASVAQYVSQKKAELEREQKDPLAGLQVRLEKQAFDNQTAAQRLYDQMQTILGSAPKLFGEMTPEQIDTYLAPVQRAFKQSLSVTEGASARRGLSGSSVEANALAAQEGQFKEQTQAEGLRIGLESQKNKAAAIQNQINQLLGLTRTELPLATEVAKQKSSQDLGQSNLIASLPYFLRQSALQEQQVRKGMEASAGGGGIGSTIGGGIGAVAGGLYGGPAGARAGYFVGSGVGGAAGEMISPSSGGGGTTASTYANNAINSLLMAYTTRGLGSGGQPAGRVPIQDDSSGENSYFREPVKLSEMPV